MKHTFPKTSRRLPFVAGDFTTEGVFLSQDKDGKATFRNIHGGTSTVGAGCREIGGVFTLDVVNACSQAYHEARIAAHGRRMAHHVATGGSVDWSRNQHQYQHHEHHEYHHIPIPNSKWATCHHRANQRAMGIRLILRRQRSGSKALTNRFHPRRT